MNAYIYCADIYCEGCASAIKKDLHAKGLRPAYYKNESQFDSSEWPKGPFEDGGGESDSPQHCGNHEKCLNAIVWPDGTKSGCFLENPLTEEGYSYVRDLETESPSEITKLWLKFYDID